MQTLDLTRTYTYEEYVEISERPEYAGRKVELLDGEIIAKDEATGQYDSFIAAIIMVFAGGFVLQRRSGVVTSSNGEYRLNEDSALIPDGSFTSWANAKDIESRDVFYPPDLAIEVISKSEKPRDIRSKTITYLNNGSSAVWHIYPTTRNIEVFTLEPDSVMPRRVVFGPSDMLDGGAVLPGFTLDLREFWAQIDARPDEQEKS